MSRKLLPQNRTPHTFARTISRRAVLRGAGVVMALPWLESARVFGAPAAFPKRFGVMFMGCGINEDYWSASGNGAGMTLSKTLSPLEPLKHKINVVDGLFNKAATGQGIHPAQTGSVLRRIAQQQFGWLRSHLALARRAVQVSCIEVGQHAGR